MIEKKPRKIEPVEPINIKHQSLDGRVIEKKKKGEGFKQIFNSKMDKYK
jgi:hypothetical protein